MGASEPTKHRKQSSKTPRAQSGSINHVLEYMKEQGIPLTRENYLNEAYMGEPPVELGPEEEVELPEEFQRWGDR